VLDRARNSDLIITPSAIDVVLESTDYLRRWLTYLEASLDGGTEEQPARDESLCARIGALSTAGSSPAPVSTGQVSMAPNPGEPEAAGEVSIPEAPVPEAAVPETSSGGRRETMAVKVDTAKLDYLVDMAGEMVIAEALVRHDPEMATVKSQRLQRNIAQMTRITAELQKTAMAMRLVPIGPLFHRMARLVRDLARQFGKSVDMVTEGDEIELDRTIVEELSDPLMHMVRNAMDHGIETPEDRLKRGKQATACVALKAQHRAGQVVIEVGDDGRGLNREKILATAIERGLVAAGDGLDDAEVFSLIFEPGFTTAAAVTNVSGRGVGMDVVRRHIEKLRGRIEIRSVLDAGTTFFLKLPLTLAIIDGLVVGVGCERYIVPMFAVREMFRPKPETLWTVQQRGEMALVRGTLLPVLRLYRRFGVTPRSEDPLQSVLVVVEAEGQRFCLVVDDLIGKQEVVIKGLGDLFKQIGGVAGGAILGDGRVGLILDVDRLYKGWVGDGSR
jgi:two-component system chemotaxis sensor kinase CheA